MSDSIDINALATPIGILPEIDFGDSLEGTTVGVGGAVLGAPTFIHKGTAYDADDVIGLRISINANIYVVTAYVPGTKTFTITPVLVANILEDDVVYLIFIPIQNRVKSLNWETMKGRMNEGNVGGQYKSESYEAGISGKLTIEAVLGRDYYVYDGTLMIKSSLLAYLLTADGILNNVDGSLTPRDTDADIASFALTYRPKSGFSRWLKGCTVKRGAFAYDNDLHAPTKITLDILYQKIVYDELPTYTLVADIFYDGFNVKSRGGTWVYFRYFSTIMSQALAAQPDVIVSSVLGFNQNDWVTLTDPNTGLTEEAEIQGITPATNTLTMAGGLTNTYPAETSICEHVQGGANDTYNNPRIQKLDFSMDNMGEQIGDIGSGSELATTTFAGGSDYGGTAEFTRKDQVMLPWITAESQFSYFSLEIHHKANQQFPTIKDLVMILVCKKKSNPKETFSNDYERQMDELSFQVSDIRELAIRKF